MPRTSSILASSAFSDLGVTERGDPFIVMELLKGEDLRELLRRTVRLTPIRAVQLLLPIADALATAHAQGIVHRDLKPENVFIVGLEQRILPKIVDFGIAKPGWPCDRRLTRAGTVMGSPEYMSPEQALGREDVDQRVDVWSFCIVLYECLVGRPPFFGNYESTLTEILENQSFRSRSSASPSPHCGPSSRAVLPSSGSNAFRICARSAEHWPNG